MVLTFKGTVLLCIVVFAAFCILDLIFCILKEVIRGKIGVKNLNAQIDAAIAKIARSAAELLKKKEGPSDDEV